MAIAVVYRPPALTAERCRTSWASGSPTPDPQGLLFHAGPSFLFLTGRGCSARRSLSAVMTIPTQRTASIWTRVGSRRGRPTSSLGGTSAYPSILRSQHDRSPRPSPARVEVSSSRSAVSAVAAARGQCSPAWLSSRAPRPLKPSLGFVPHIVPTPSRRRSRRSGCGGSLSGLSPIQAIRLHTRSGDIPERWLRER